MNLTHLKYEHLQNNVLTEEALSPADTYKYWIPEADKY